MPGEIGRLQCGQKMSLVWIGEPGKRFQMAEELEIGCTCLMFIVHIDIYRATLLRSGSIAKRNVLHRAKLPFLAEHIEVP